MDYFPINNDAAAFRVGDGMKESWPDVEEDPNTKWKNEKYKSTKTQKIQNYTTEKYKTENWKNTTLEKLKVGQEDPNTKIQKN